MVYHDGGFFIFGGHYRTVIARFDEKVKTWENLGDLKNLRWHHNVIHDGLSFVVVGGYSRRD